MVFPLGPFPVVETQGICEKERVLRSGVKSTLVAFDGLELGFRGEMGFLIGSGGISDLVCWLNLVELDRVSCSLASINWDCSGL